jgi:hypothetical protein
MNQIVHIFRKDTRHFWLEIVASFAALAIYVVHYPARWNGVQYHPSLYQQPNDNSAMCVVLVAWWLLTARVIHAESLVGENHFWLTRPYERKKLLAAKALFVGVWIYIPFVIAQALVLREARFSPLGRASGWLLMLTLYSGVFIIPLIAIASLTANFARMALAVFGSYLAAIACYLWITNRSEVHAVSIYSHGYGTLVPYSHFFMVVVFAVVSGAAVVLLQYATRRVWLSRVLGVSLAVLGLGGALALSRMPQREVDRQYPVASSGVAAELQLAFAPTPSNPLTVGVWPNNVFIPFPIDLSGVPEGAAVEVDNMQFSMDTADGQHWTSPWRQLNATPFLPGAHAPSLPFILSRSDYERFKSVPVTLHVTLAVTELHEGSETTATIANPAFPVSGFGVCSTQWGERSTSFLLCRSEFGELPLTYVKTAFSDNSCSGPKPQQKDVRTFAEWMGKAYADPVDASSDLIRLTFAQSAAYDNRGYPHGTHDLALCPGTPAQFTHYDVVRRSRAYLTVSNFQLPQAKQ